MEPRCQVKLAVQLHIVNMGVLLSLNTRLHIKETLLGGDKTHLDVVSVPNGLLYWKRLKPTKLQPISTLTTPDYWITWGEHLGI